MSAVSRKQNAAAGRLALSAAGTSLGDGNHLYVVPDLDLPTLEDVRADASSVDELSQHRPRGIALYHCAGLAETRATTAHLAYREFMSDQPIHIDSPRDEVASVLVGPERRVERLAYLSGNDRQRASRPAPTGMSRFRPRACRLPAPGQRSLGPPRGSAPVCRLPKQRKSPRLRPR